MNRVTLNKKGLLTLCMYKHTNTHTQHTHIDVTLVSDLVNCLFYADGKVLQGFVFVTNVGDAGVS